MNTGTTPFQRLAQRVAKADSRGFHLILPILLFSAVGAVAEDGYWINSSGGNWASAANWDPANGIAGGADNTAYFGFSREAAISPNAFFTIGGAQTIGNLCFLTQNGPATWSFSAAAGGSLTLESTFGTPQITVASPQLQVSLNVAVAGNSGVEKDGAGTLVLSAVNTYAGQTLVNGGGLSVTGSIGSGGVNVANATLTGSGVINGPVVVGSGGTLALGNSGGPLTINNSLALLPGSTTSVSLNGQPLVQGLTSVSYGGTLIISGLSGKPALGETFSIFGSAPATGNFSQILPPPGPWLRWKMDPATGQITVVSSASQPFFANASLASNNLVCQVTGGPPGSAGYVVATTDLSAAPSSWTPIGTNVFDMSGSFTSTNTLGANGPGQMYFAVMVIPAP